MPTNVTIPDDEDEDGNINETVDISGIQIEGEEDGIPTDVLESEEDQQEALKKLSNVKHYKINMNAIHDQFLVGVGLMSDVLNELKEKQKKDKKHRDHVDAAVEHFREISQHRRTTLNEILLSNDDDLDEFDWEIASNCL